MVPSPKPEKKVRMATRKAAIEMIIISIDYLLQKDRFFQNSLNIFSIKVAIIS